jgi:hypothetical protein
MATDTTRDMDAWAMPRRAGIVGAYAVHIHKQAALGQADFETAFRNAAAISRASTFARSLACTASRSTSPVRSARTGTRPLAADRPIPRCLTCGPSSAVLTRAMVSGSASECDASPSVTTRDRCRPRARRARPGRVRRDAAAGTR